MAGQQTNVGTVTAQDANSPPDTPVTDDNPGNYFGVGPAIQVVKLVNGQDADSAPGPHVAVGSTVTFTYEVTNTGNILLANVVVSDDKLGPIAGPASGDANGDGLLDLGETWTYTTTATAVAGQQTNVGTATAQDAIIGITVTDNNPGNYFGDAPGINVVKFANGDDADTAPGPHVAVGSTITFTYVVTNTGNVPLSGVAVTDDKLGSITSFTGDTDGNGLLDLTETWTYTTTATAVAGQQTNVGTATASNPNLPADPAVTDDNPGNYFGDAPGINVVKFVNGQDADSPTGPHVAVGSTVTFTYVVTNTGNVPLANVVVSDDKLGPIAGPASGDANGDGLLDPTETWTYTTTATAVAGQQTNVGTVTAQDANSPPGITVTDDNPANYFGDAATPQAADLAVAKTAGSGPFTVGQQITYTLTVTNHGPSDDPDVVLVDQLPAGMTFVSASVPPASQSSGRLTFRLGTLAVGASATVIVVARADDAGTLVNQASASGALPDLVSSNDAASLATTVSQTAPTVVSLQRFGFHEQPTSLVLAFSEPLDPARAQDLGNYRLILIAHGGRLHLPVRLSGAVYDATSRTVTLRPARPLPLRFRYMLTVNGTSPTGVSGASGVLLDGDGDGQPGGNYVRTFGREILAGPNRSAGLREHGLVRHSPPGRIQSVRLSGTRVGPFGMGRPSTCRHDVVGRGALRRRPPPLGGGCRAGGDRRAASAEVIASACA